MSWILGCTSTSLSRDVRERLVAFRPRGAPPGTLLADGPRLALVAGGLPDTLRHGPLPDGGWVVVGLGLRLHDGRAHPLQEADWAALLARDCPDLSDLDGHFVAMRWRGDTVEAFTDALGLRTLYLYETDDGLCFSTRLDGMARLGGPAVIDFSAFGSHWLAFNQLDTRGLLAGVRRLGPGGRWTAEAGRRRHFAEQDWSPPPPPDRPAEAVLTRLHAALHPALPAGRRLSLGLSGGIDSRLLLAMLARTPDADVQLHTFGSPDHPDARIAHRLAAATGLPHVHLDAPVPEADTCWSLLLDHVALTQGVSPASAVLGLRQVRSLYDAGCWMVDGGFGEILRRQFFNRLLHRGRRALQRGSAADLAAYLRFHRADVFTADVTRRMTDGLAAAMEQRWASLSALARHNPETAADLLGVRVRLPGFFGFEQNRLDALIPSYMPFAQPSLLAAVFGLPVALRRNGRFVRQTIRRHAPALARLPLVKGGTTYPFALPTLPAHLWTALQARLGRRYADSARTSFLATLRPLVLDLLHSAAVRTYAPYDRKKLKALVEGYYAGDDARAAAVDWWLAFEAWRQAIGAR
ncbi:hypothetical protein AWN76_004355 [Rhodothermaceae bacterium RA]|nr:hypothetical protein AWN76_004355 [Rhodothermaceae bacterium RA]